jgi:hypothetical protein
MLVQLSGHCSTRQAASRTSTHSGRDVRCPMRSGFTADITSLPFGG